MFYPAGINMFKSIILSLLLVIAMSFEKTVSDIGLDITIEESFTQDRLEDLLTVVLDRNLNQPVFQLRIDNSSGETKNNVYLVVEISSDKMGPLITARQDESTYFSLSAGESIRFHNLNMAGQLTAESQEPLLFDFTITAMGRKVLQNLQTGAVVTDDNYRLNIRVEMKTGNSINVLAENSAEFETTLNEEELTIDPDEAALSSLALVNVKEVGPAFGWKGDGSDLFRLIVVEDNGSGNFGNILSERFNTPHSTRNIRDIENGVVLDVMVKGSEYRLPNNLASFFEQGKRYVWQVQTHKQTVAGGQIVAYSERLGFEPRYSIEGEIKDLLVNLFGREKTEKFIQEGLLLDRIEIDGVVYSKQDVLSILRDINGKIDENKVRVAI